MELKGFLEKVLDKSIFKDEVKATVADRATCTLCNGSGRLRIEMTPSYVPCPSCRGSGTSINGTKKVDAKVLYTPIAFEENKERVLFVSISYEENGKTINTSVKLEDIEIENKLEDKQQS